MLRHALVMLSSREEPDPDEEVRYHRDRCAAHGTTYLVLTRRLTELSPGQSRVALYGDAALENRLLAWGKFASIWPLEATRAREVLQDLSLYANGRLPSNAKWVVGLTDVELAPEGSGIELLNGEMEESGKELRDDNLPSSAARSLLYFRVRRNSPKAGGAA